MHAESHRTRQTFDRRPHQHLDDCLRQVKRSVLNGTSGSDTFKMLLRLVSARYAQGHRSASIADFHLFEVATKTPFADYSRDFWLLIASVTEREGVLAQSVEVVLEVVRSSFSEKYLGLVPVLSPGELAAVLRPFGSIDEMWLAFGGRPTNKIHPINSDKRFILPSLAGISLHSHASGRTQGLSAAPQPFKGS